MAPFGSTARNSIGRKPKGKTKDPDQSENFYLARMEADAAKLAAIRAAKSPATAQAKRSSHSSGIELEQDQEAEKEQKNYGDQRVVIKFFYEQFNSPPEDDWKARHGTISRIRSRMGDCAPVPDTVFRTLKRLADGDEDMAAVGRGSSACVCIKELIDAAIVEGDKVFADTAYHDSWWLCHDALSAWWEKEAQDYIASRGFKDRQLRAWGSTNRGTRYHHSLVGNRPEMMPLDAHLFADLKTAVGRHVVITAGLDEDDGTRFKIGTPGELSDTLRRVWKVEPQPYRIIEDVSRIPSTVDKIIEYRGGIVPDAVLRHGRRGARGKRPMLLHPIAQAAAKQLMGELDSEIKRMCKD